MLPLNFFFEPVLSVISLTPTVLINKISLALKQRFRHTNFGHSFGSSWWRWLAHPTLLRHVIHLVYFLFKAANFQIRHLLTFWWRFLRHSGPVRLSAYIRPMITWYLFFNLIGHWSCDMWPHLAQWWCPHFSRIFVAGSYLLD